MPINKMRPRSYYANIKLGGTEGLDKTGHMDKEEPPLADIATHVCMERNCAKGLSLPLPDLSIVEDFITMSVLAFRWG
ncbi:hypothetical protein llap_10691 [Limosa lapponica baueri]|uniref:Uncharacterized protein n=1 Tax=Limosa lapponica baueri TaxID=1758121 RepID=A0A2I0TYZ2_LIMLA|nr:hypothetical protein llap_10691 [Limosa lapponica baueri]